MTVAALARPSPRDPAPRGAVRWGASFAVALALHLAAAIGLLVWKSPIVPPPPPAAAIMIDLAPAPAAPVPAPVIPPVPAPPPPLIPPPVVQPAPAPVPVPVPLPLPPPRPVERPVPHRPVVPPKRPRPAPAPPVTMPAPAPVPVAPRPVPRAAPAAPAAPSNAVPNFESLLAAHLDRYKRYPRAAETRGEQGIAWLRFTMDRQGRVLAFRLERSSGHATLDDEVLALIRRAQPLPPIPASIASSRLEVVVPVRFSLR